jgi:hypothetical protein
MPSILSLSAAGINPRRMAETVESYAEQVRRDKKNSASAADVGIDQHNILFPIRSRLSVPRCLVADEMIRLAPGTGLM